MIARCILPGNFVAKGRLVREDGLAAGNGVVSGRPESSKHPVID